MPIVSVRASVDDWSGAFIAPWGIYPFDRSYTKSEWENLTRYLTALGASAEKARETLMFGRRKGPKVAAEQCAQASNGKVTAAELMTALNDEISLQTSRH